ncbi:MAG TPA: 2-phospho-L-lactate guanylyltransferase [Mycobacteriales bacterium]|nr:2-phospho-L-lactate guanylyltransferase [Mycobacteriales bacterium]
MRWSVVVPVKRLPAAKTRLQDPRRAPADHAALALALALDTVRAAAGSPVVARVVVVTDDADAGRAVRALDALVVRDEPDAGLNPALTHGAGAARRIAPDDGIAVLSADLPALRPAELTAALTAAAVTGRAFVPDAAGTGTTLLAAGPGAVLDPRYGPGSRAGHRASGAVELAGDWPSLRRDVDTAADLAEAAALGLGPATRDWLASHPAEDPGTGRTIRA